MKLSRRGVLATGISFICAGAAKAQGWPGRPVRIIVGYPAGGPTDVVARLAAEALREPLGVPVVVENRSGANGSIGAVAAARSDPDGTTLYLGPVQTQVLNPLLMRNLAYDPLKDFAPVGTVAALPNVLTVNPQVTDVRSVGELVERAKSQRGGLTYGTYGPGSSPHMLAVLLQQKAGFEALQVPYQGSAPASAALLAGDINFLFDNITTTAGQVQGGRVRALAVTSRTRSPTLPDIPTMEEAGIPGFDLAFWFALYAPARTPAPIMERLREAWQRATANPELERQLRARGAEPFLVPAAQLDSFFQGEAKRWAELVQAAGLKPE